MSVAVTFPLSVFISILKLKLLLIFPSDSDPEDWDLFCRLVIALDKRSIDDGSPLISEMDYSEPDPPNLIVLTLPLLRSFKS